MSTLILVFLVFCSALYYIDGFYILKNKTHFFKKDFSDNKKSASIIDVILNFTIATNALIIVILDYFIDEFLTTGYFFYIFILFIIVIIYRDTKRV